MYEQRTGVERLNSRMKAFYRLDSIRVRGKMKVALHALLSAVALEARASRFPKQPVPAFHKHVLDNRVYTYGLVKSPRKQSGST